VQGTTQNTMTAPAGLPALSTYQNPTAPYYADPTQQVIADRQNAINSLPDWNYFRADYQQMDPTVRSNYERNLQQAYGIPIASTQNQADRYALAGLNRSPRYVHNDQGY
jgi:hypothetical protein